MQLRTGLFILFLLAGTAAAKAQETAEDAIKKYTAAIGGIDAQKKIKTMKFEGVMKQGGMEFPMTIQVIHDRAMRADITVQGMNITSAFKDSSGWSVNPLQGSTTPAKMNEEEKKGAKDQCDLIDDLADYKAKGHKAELIGKEDVDGVETIKIKLTKKNGDVEQYFLDAETYLPIKSSTKMKFGDSEVESETYYSDYKEVAGVKMPFTTQIKSGGQVVMETAFKKIEANITISESIFDMPK